jgi:hypothetical protein
VTDRQHKNGGGGSFRKKTIGFRTGLAVAITVTGIWAAILVIRPGQPAEKPLAARLADTAESLPHDVSLFLVPRLNPDGLAGKSRHNARGVDLNRNWQTNNWRPDEAESADGAPAAGGPSPFSEPETAAFSSWLLGLRDQSTSRLSVIIYHSACPPKGLIQPGYRITSGRQETDPNAAKLGRHWSSKLGYDYSPTWPEYLITGEAIHWCAENQITCIDVELPSANDPTAAEAGLHLSALLDMIPE